MPLVNRVALITGGSRGIGRGIAVRLAQEGARIAISYRSNKTAAQQALRQLQASGADCVAVETDVTDAARAEQLVETVGDPVWTGSILSSTMWGGGFRWGIRWRNPPLEDWQSIFYTRIYRALSMSAVPPCPTCGVDAGAES